MENGSGGDWLQNLQLIIPIAIIIIFGIVMRRRQGGRTKLEVAGGLLRDVKYNLKMTDTLSSTWQTPKRLKTDNWSRNKDKIEFLEQSVQDELNNAFNIAEDYNQRITAAKQHKSTSYLMGIEPGKLSNSLAKSQEGLETWIRENYQTEISQRPRRGLFG